jgi:hypothetical protein
MLRKAIIALFVVLAFSALGTAGVVKLLDGGRKALDNAASHLPGVASGSPTSSADTAPAGPVASGAGPSGAYTVQKQPAPGSCQYRWVDKAKGFVLPDPSCTPGATNPKVTQASLGDTICRSGYTSSIRPPASITGREKAANAKSYGYTGSSRVGEYDHLISLELGGDPNDSRNLWVEPNHDGATGTLNPKDNVENKLHSLVCNGDITLAAAQRAIAQDWTTALVAVGHPNGK